MIADEGSDDSNIELLSSTIRQYNERLEGNEHWLGYHAIDDIKSQTVIDVLKVRFKFEVSNAFMF